MRVLGIMPAVGHTTASANTVITAICDPSRAGGRPFLYAVDASQVGANGYTGKANWTEKSIGLLRVTKLLYTTTSTAHKIGLMRPLNWSYCTAAVAANGTAVTLKDDPGKYSTNYRYPLPGGNTKPINTADSSLAASDYIAYQLLDGTWVLDLVSAFNTTTFALTLTTAAPNVTGGGIAIYTPFFTFGIVSDVDPGNYQGHWQTTTIANTNRTDVMQGYNGESVQPLRYGDPLAFYSPNTSNAGTLDGIFGHYAGE